DAGQVGNLRRKAACELHGVCAEFVASVNRQLTEATLDLSPPTFTPESFRDSGVNLIQMGSQGREIQVTFEATREPFSTEKVLVPYILEGELRAYNQEMLERLDIRNRLVFYCVGEVVSGWRHFDWRTRQTGPVDGRFLLHLMEPLF